MKSLLHVYFSFYTGDPHCWGGCRRTRPSAPQPEPEYARARMLSRLVLWCRPRCQPPSPPQPRTPVFALPYFGAPVRPGPPYPRLRYFLPPGGGILHPAPGLCVQRRGALSAGGPTSLCLQSVTSVRRSAHTPSRNRDYFGYDSNSTTSSLVNSLAVARLPEWGSAWLFQSII